MHNMGVCGLIKVAINLIPKTHPAFSTYAREKREGPVSLRHDCVMLHSQKVGLKLELF